jgi:hypothetical protein
MLESEVKKGIKDKLRSRKLKAQARAWSVTDTSLGSKQVGGLKDFPDLICIRFNHVVLMEVKRPGGAPTDGQWKWRENIAPHLGRNVHHMFIYHPDSVPDWMLE